MKKLFTILTVMLFSLTTFTSCEKPIGITNESQTLSEFVIGEWQKSTAVNSFIYITRIPFNRYIIYRKIISPSGLIDESNNRIMQSEGRYIIDEDANTITITGVDYQKYFVFYVTWMGDADTMIWTEYNESDNPQIESDNPQIIKWTRS
jgi:hypothetical protein